MPDLVVQQSQNLWLNALSAADRGLLDRYLTRVEIDREQVLVASDRPPSHVYFPDGGVVSVVAQFDDTQPTEVGIFGREGFSATSALMGVDRLPVRSYVQIDGATALRMPIAAMHEALEESATLRARVLFYIHTVMIQMAYNVVSNARHPLEARLARWLLMCHDRVHGDEIALTHEFMAVMIGAQRTGVTVTLHVLEGGGSIRSRRGRVIILDRERLEDLAGSSYGRPEAEYTRLIADFGQSPGN